MQFIEERVKTPVCGEFDVIVVGGGPAGIGAAIAAARKGVSVLLIEKYGCLGGMWTSGLVNPLFDYENKGGIVQEIVNEISAQNQNSSSGKMYTFDFETMKLVLDRMTLKAGVTLLFYSYFVGVIQSESRLGGVLVENKAGRGAYLAKVVIDCTGDGDVAARAGASFTQGRPGDGACQPMTLMFKVGNMDYVQQYDDHYDEGNELYQLMKKAATRAGLKDYKFNFIKPAMLHLPGAHRGVCQMTHMRGFNGVDPYDLTKALVEGRERVHEAMRFFTAYMPQFQDAQLEQTAEMLGVRETRRIHGRYTLTLDDIANGRRFEDGVCLCAFGIDIHQPDGISQEDVRRIRFQPYQIPYRTMLPTTVENLLVAGRCVSGSYEAHASYRVTGDCVAMGQAAGTAAAMAVREGIAPGELDGSRLVCQLREDGALTAGREG